MKVLVVGSGGREHALAWKISQSSLVTKVYSSADIKPTDIDKLLQFAKDEKIDLTVVGPENALDQGLVDLFKSHGLKIFGPSKLASQLETSKAFAKEIMMAASVPTAGYETFQNFESAVQFIERTQWNQMVVKCDGLAAGKGVVVCQNKAEAYAAVKSFMVDDLLGFKAQNLLIEEFLVGPEVSVFAISDGNDVVFVGSAQDHKRLRDNDLGPNTGGMGVVSPSPVFTADDQKTVMEVIIKPTVNEMKKRGMPFTGVLFAGLMKTAQGYKTLEFNVRFGDPETQALMCLIDEDIVPWLLQSSEEKFNELRDLHLKSQKAVHVVMAAHGYPGTEGIPVRSGDVIKLPSVVDQQIFFAGVKKSGDDLVTSGGRVLGITSVSETYSKACELAYAQVSKIQFEGAQYRRDIGRSL